MDRALALVLASALVGSIPVAAQQTWVERHRAPTAGAPAMAYDVARGRTVLIGGTDYTHTLQETWQWNGARWARSTPSVSPSARSYAGMVDDTARGRLVMFGGLGASSTFGDTWFWDGVDWTAATPPTSPSARQAHAMAYDVARDRVVLFGGALPYPSFPYGDTWEFDGTTWVQRQVAGPAARVAAAMAYDPIRQRTVLFGGLDSSGQALNDTWQWDGTVWTRIDLPHAPPVSPSPAMAYDPVQQQIVVAGAGYNGEQTWSFDGTDWTRLPDGPLYTRDARLVFDQTIGRLVLERSSETWGFDGTSWTLADRWLEPDPGTIGGVAQDTIRNRTVVFGGARTQLETWEWDGTDWTRHQPPNGSTTPEGAAVAFDRARAQTLCFGGTAASNLPPGNTLWAWKGANWQYLPAPTHPPGRMDHAMAYDVARQRMVVFGGFDGAQLLNDTWEWDGTAWSQQSIAGPPARSHHAMAYDEGRQRTVLFGGEANGVLGDTWEYDGAGWTQRTPLHSPPARREHAMAYDATRGTVVLFGGDTGTMGSALDDTWEWDGTDWSPLALVVSPPARSGHGMAYDPARQQLVVFGGSNALKIGGTWTLGDSPVVLPYGSACASSGTPPSLAVLGLPAIANAGFALDVQSVPSAPFFLLLSGRRATLPYGGCTVLVDPTAGLTVLPGTTNFAGFTSFPLPLPPVPGLIGLHVYSQALGVDPAAPGNLLTTAGRELLVGR